MPYRAMVAILCCMAIAGCGGTRKSSLLLERHSRGMLDESLAVGHYARWQVEPVMQTKTQSGVEVIANYASQEFLNNFFKNEKVFGPYAGHNPYYAEHFVFYVKVANRSQRKIGINPAEFALIDDRGNQLSAIGVDYVTAFAEFRQPVSTVTRGVIEEARPGYFGFSLPVGRFFAQKPQWRFALLKQSSLQAGYLHSSVAHDGLIAFWNPSTEAKTIKLILTNIKTDFDANDWPRESLDVVFEFKVSAQ